MARLNRAALPLETLDALLGLAKVTLKNGELSAQGGEHRRRVLLLLARLVDLLLGELDRRHSGAALFVQAGEFAADLLGFPLELNHLVLSLENGVRRIARRAAMQDAVSAQDCARERDDRRAVLRENPERGFDIRHEHGVIDKALDEPLHLRARFYLVNE